MHTATIMATAELLADHAEVGSPHSWELPDGRRATLTIEPDQDFSLLDESGEGLWWCGALEWSHASYDRYAPRPDGFNGRARIIDTDGSSRLWWQPPTDVADADLFRLRVTISEVLKYGALGFIVRVDARCSCCDRWSEVGESSLWGCMSVDSAYAAELTADLLTSAIAEADERHPANA